MREWQAVSGWSYVVMKKWTGMMSPILSDVVKRNKINRVFFLCEGALSSINGSLFAQTVPPSPSFHATKQFRRSSHSAKRKAVIFLKRG